MDRPGARRGERVGTEAFLLAERYFGTQQTVVQETQEANLPNNIGLEQNTPNPFNNNTIIDFSLPSSGSAELTIFNTTAQLVVTLLEGFRDAGNYALNWDGRDNKGKMLPTGVYFYRLRFDGHTRTRKLLLLR